MSAPRTANSSYLSVRGVLAEDRREAAQVIAQFEERGDDFIGPGLPQTFLRPPRVSVPAPVTHNDRTVGETGAQALAQVDLVLESGRQRPQTEEVGLGLGRAIDHLPGEGRRVEDLD